MIDKTIFDISSVGLTWPHHNVETPWTESIWTGQHGFCRFLGIIDAGGITMMTSWHENNFVLLTLCEGNHRWVPSPKGPVMRSFDIFFILAWKGFWTNGRVAGNERFWCGVVSVSFLWWGWCEIFQRWIKKINFFQCMGTFWNSTQLPYIYIDRYMFQF